MKAEDRHIEFVLQTWQYLQRIPVQKNYKHRDPRNIYLYENTEFVQEFCVATRHTQLTGVQLIDSSSCVLNRQKKPKQLWLLTTSYVTTA
eukprot:2633581-Rhodomonas_salina.2